MKAFINLFKKDMVIALRNALIWVLIGTLVLLVGFVRFLMPEDFQQNQSQYIYDKSQEQVLQKVFTQSEGGNFTIVNSQKALEASLEKNPYSIGVVFEGSIDQPQFSILHQKNISEKNQRIINASLEKLIAGLRGIERTQQYQVEFLRQQAKVIPKNLTSVPVLLTFEVLIIGFLFIAVFMFQEKNEGSIRAYQISPGGVFLYIISKVMVFIVIGLLYGLSFVLLTLGTSVNLLTLSLLIVLGVALYTLIGIIVAVFFNNISDWFFVGMGVLTLNILPAISYGLPTFAPKFITIIPSYSIMSALREVLFPTGKSIVPALNMLIIGNILAFGICYLVVKRRLMKEGQ